jgi:hypothetical protein
MLVPMLTGTTQPASHVFHLCGALVITSAVIAMGEVFRAVRWLDAPLGVALALVPLWLDGADTASRIAGVALGLSIAALAIPRGPKRERYGGWDRAIV